MKLIVLLCVLIFSLSSEAQTCTALYSYGATSTKVNFFNQTISANGHYYWNFGDGTGSNVVSPAHEYTDDGIYLVTLYVNDTLSACSSYYEQWLTITKSSLDPCTPLITDSIYYDSLSYYKCLLKILDESSNCSLYSPVYNVGNGSGPQSNIVGLGLWPGNYIAVAYYFDASNNFKRSALKTCPNNFSRSKNYNACSANFEFCVTAEDSLSQTILLTAMNKHAASYEWLVPGFGAPIYSSYDTISITYPMSPYVNYPNISMDAILTIREADGCRDSLRQFVIVKTKSSTTVGFKEINADKLNAVLSSNPNNGVFTIDFSDPAILNVNLRVTNSIGESVVSTCYIKNNEEIDISRLANGLYCVQLMTNMGQKVFKVIKQ